MTPSLSSFSLEGARIARETKTIPEFQGNSDLVIRVSITEAFQLRRQAQSHLSKICGSNF